MRKLAAKTLMEILPPEIEQMVCDCIFCRYLFCHHLLLSLYFCHYLFCHYLFCHFLFLSLSFLVIIFLSLSIDVLDCCRLLDSNCLCSTGAKEVGREKLFCGLSLHRWHDYVRQACRVGCSMISYDCSKMLTFHLYLSKLLQ